MVLWVLWCGELWDNVWGGWVTNHPARSLPRTIHGFLPLRTPIRKRQQLSREAMNIQESLHSILGQQETFADLFYLVFLDRYPEVRQHFQGVNLKHQAVLLTMALMVIERNYTSSYPSTRQYLRYLGSKHHERGIPADSYPKFQSAFLDTLARFHSKDWNPALARQWNEAIERAAEFMLEGYRVHLSI
jgi:hemoglobin-like flavoprotein